MNNDFYTQWNVKSRLSIVRVVWLCVNCVLVWTCVTDCSVYLCECVLCACLNTVRFATTDFRLHKTGFRTWMYIASRMFRCNFDRQRASPKIRIIIGQGALLFLLPNDKQKVTIHRNILSSLLSLVHVWRKGEEICVTFYKCVPWSEASRVCVSLSLSLSLSLSFSLSLYLSLYLFISLPLS